MGETARCRSEAQTRRWLQMLAGGSLFAGSVHAGLCPAHFQEAFLFGVFFAVVAILQLAWAGLVVSRPSRRLLAAGAIGNVTVIAVWAVSRTIGIPFGPTPWRAEAVGLGDIATSLVELAVAVAAVAALRAGLTGDPLAPALGARLWREAAKVRALLPVGQTLPDDVWAQRHRWIAGVLWLHAPGIFLFAFFRGQTAVGSALEAAIVVTFGVAVHWLRRHRRVATVVTSIGLLTCSAQLVRLSGGAIEMHFHYFVMVGVVTLYQDWWPFLVAIGYVVLQHGLIGVLDPSAVYNHRSAIAHPWEWAGIHGLFVVGMSAAGIASWRLNESLLAGVVEREQQLEEAQEVAHLGGWEHSLITGKTTWSAELYRLLGVEPTEVSAGPETFLACVHPEDRPAIEAGLADVWASGAPFAGDLRIVHPDGIRWLHCRAKVTTFTDGAPTVVSGTVQEITERKNAESSIRQTLSLLGATLDATADGILVVDNDGKITSFNRRFADMWHLPADILASRDDDRALAYVVDQVADPKAFVGKVRELYAQPEAESQDVIEFRDGRVFERFSTPQRVGGKPVGRVWSFRDITERTRLERELSHQAFHDSLTNLANQALFRDRVDHALVRAARHGTRLAVVFLDLDNFKTVNDSLGHTAGDELLVAVATRLESCLRSTDTAARLGGDEFAVLLEDVGTDAEASALAERMIETLQRPFCPGGREIYVSASIGIAFSSTGSTSDQLLRNGDLAMYTAKRRGKACFETYRAEMHATAVERLEMEADLRRAVATGQLRVHYQPIYTLASRALVGVEALVRWDHPSRGMLGPAAFVPIAEETGLIRVIGHHVLAEAGTQMRHWQRELPAAQGLAVSVNVSQRQLHDDEFIETIEDVLRASGLAPDALVLEFTETAMMHDTEATIEKLHRLKALGVRLAIDDFGTGYSSLSYLQRFPVDILKIDRAFVAGIAPDEPEASLAAAIVSLARVLGLEAIAEGVESEREAELLAALGCEFGQGFHFSAPLEPQEVVHLLSATAVTAPL